MHFKKAFEISGTRSLPIGHGLSAITQVIPDNLIHIKDFCVAENYSPDVIFLNPLRRAFWTAV
jgi:hypothetical protein